MKTYNQTFTCVFTVQQLAVKLLNTMCPKPEGYDDAKNEVTDNPQYFLDNNSYTAEVAQSFIDYSADLEYYTRLVESIIDNVADNGSACADIFNALNGWVKTETPMDRKETVEQADTIVRFTRPNWDVRNNMANDVHNSIEYFYGLMNNKGRITFQYIACNYTMSDSSNYKKGFEDLEELSGDASLDKLNEYNKTISDLFNALQIP